MVITLQRHFKENGDNGGTTVPFHACRRNKLRVWEKENPNFESRPRQVIWIRLCADWTFRSLNQWEKLFAMIDARQCWWQLIFIFRVNFRTSHLRVRFAIKISSQLSSFLLKHNYRSWSCKSRFLKNDQSRKLFQRGNSSRTCKTKRNK